MIKTTIVDGRGTGVVAHVHKFPGLKKDHAGQLVLQERFVQLSPEVHPFINSSFGVAMNQSISFGGTPEIIHNGGTSTEWTGTALSGNWDFADAGKVSLTNGNNNNAATFDEETGYSIDMDGFTTLTGKINLSTYDEANNSLTVIFNLDGVSVGNSIDLNDHIDAGLIGSEQNFVIPKAEFGLLGQLVNGFTITVVRTGGGKPAFTLDDIQLEETGDAAVFKATTPVGTRYHITQIRIGLADNISGIITGSTTTYPTMPGLAYDAILGVSALSNGIVFTRVQKGVTQFSVVLKKLGDFLTTGSNMVNMISDGTNTYITLMIEFPEPIILEGGDDSFMSYTINDDLSALLQFSAAALGAIEV